MSVESLKKKPVQIPETKKKTPIKKVTSQELIEDLQQTIHEFITDLRDNIFGVEEQGDLLLVEFFFKKMSGDDLMNHVVQHVLPHADYIEKREVSFFFKKKDEIFKGLSSDKVDYFANLVITPENEGGLSSEDLDTTWSYFDTILEIAETYKKIK